MKLGIQILHENMTAKELLAVAHHCEALGFDSIWLGDHFWWSNPEKPMFETWTLITYLLSNTFKIKVGSLVLNNMFRNPAILVHMLNTLHTLSEGRYMFGIGAGWHKRELADAEPWITWKSAKQRIDDLEISLEYIKDKVDLPVWIGGYGDYILKRVVAKHGDACNFERFDLSPNKCRERLHYLEEWCNKYDNHLDTRSICLNICFDETVKTPTPLHNLLTRDYFRLAVRNPGLTWDFMKKKLGFKAATTLTGDTEAILMRLGEYADVGINYFIIRYINGDLLHRLATEVYPEIL